MSFWKIELFIISSSLLVPLSMSSLLLTFISTIPINKLTNLNYEIYKVIILKVPIYTQYYSRDSKFLILYSYSSVLIDEKTSIKRTIIKTIKNIIFYLRFLRYSKFTNSLISRWRLIKIHIMITRPLNKMHDSTHC